MRRAEETSEEALLCGGYAPAVPSTKGLRLRRALPPPCSRRQENCRELVQGRSERSRGIEGQSQCPGATEWWLQASAGLHKCALLISLQNQRTFLPRKC